jgi:hypothetical protein
VPTNQSADASSSCALWAATRTGPSVSASLQPAPEEAAAYTTGEILFEPIAERYDVLTARGNRGWT